MGFAVLAMHGSSARILSSGLRPMNPPSDMRLNQGIKKEGQFGASNGHGIPACEYLSIIPVKTNQTALAAALISTSSWQ